MSRPLTPEWSKDAGLCIVAIDAQDYATVREIVAEYYDPVDPAPHARRIWWQILGKNNDDVEWDYVKEILQTVNVRTISLLYWASLDVRMDPYRLSGAENEGTIDVGHGFTLRWEKYYRPKTDKEFEKIQYRYHLYRGSDHVDTFPSRFELKSWLTVTDSEGTPWLYLNTEYVNLKTLRVQNFGDSGTIEYYLWNGDFIVRHGKYMDDHFYQIRNVRTGKILATLLESDHHRGVFQDGRWVYQTLEWRSVHNGCTYHKVDQRNEDLLDAAYDARDVGDEESSHFYNWLFDIWHDHFFGSYNGFDLNLWRDTVLSERVWEIDGDGVRELT